MHVAAQTRESVGLAGARGVLYWLRSPRTDSRRPLPAEARLRSGSFSFAHREFFKTNPVLANEFLSHPYFEVRVAAAKYADVFR